MPLIISGLVFAAVAIVGYVVLAVFFSEERQVARQMRHLTDWESRQAAEAEPLLQPFAVRVLGPVGTRVARAMSSWLPAQSRERMRRQIELAGNPGGLTPEALFAVRLVLMIVLGAVALVLVLVRGVAVGTALIVVLAAIALGYAAPGLWLAELKDRRQKKIRKALPDMLDMLTISVQAGLGFDMALAKLVRTTEGPLSDEFGRMLREVQAGMSRRDALKAMGERSDVPELNNFIMAIVQADVFGVSISNILRTQAAEMRQRRRQRAEEQAQKTPVKMVFPIVLCILPATIMVVAGPAVLAIVRAFGMF